MCFVFALNKGEKDKNSWREIEDFAEIKRSLRLLPSSCWFFSNFGRSHLEFCTIMRTVMLEVTSLTSTSSFKVYAFFSKWRQCWTDAIGEELPSISTADLWNGGWLCFGLIIFVLLDSNLLRSKGLRQGTSSSHLIVNSIQITWAGVVAVLIRFLSFPLLVYCNPGLEAHHCTAELLRDGCCCSCGCCALEETLQLQPLETDYAVVSAKATLSSA